jgi:hypothetical protein
MGVVWVTKGNHTNSYVVIGRRMSGLSVLGGGACSGPELQFVCLVGHPCRRLAVIFSELVVGVLEWADPVGGRNVVGVCTAPTLLGASLYLGSGLP